MDSFFAFIMFVAGVYILNAAVALKRSGKINPSIMRSPKNAAKRIRDTEGFAAYMYPKVMLFGVTTVILGLWYLFVLVFRNSFGTILTAVTELIVIVGFFVVLFYYMHCVKVAENRFAE